MPDVPTFADKGITENGLNLIMGLYAPRALSGGVRDTLTGAVANAARDPAFVAKVEGLGLLARYEGPAAARKRLEAEYADIVALNQALQR